MSKTKKITTLSTLPRELRQTILAIAFEDAASRDIKNMEKETHALVEMVHDSRYIDQEPLFYQSYVPTICKLANALSLV
ncbi:hypothetical protein EG328_000961 [Venturia inaequalis]|uniref:Uncharacterized protein n=1 Tax=Venturia inaequalis TaxID=5025 RepID=A0A8H3ZC76_VENIN|nr:hypothetical protein EG328_000961 [Venturia inaequalis]KAE9990493.1 hypothetical protein EG327_001341 [Venturia inaequalis]